MAGVIESRRMKEEEDSIEQFGELDGAGTVTLKRECLVCPLEQTRSTDAMQ
jgi:hypothetical protein